LLAPPRHAGGNGLGGAAPHSKAVGDIDPSPVTCSGTLDIVSMEVSYIATGIPSRLR
jgi:hypothetical protein